MEVRESNLPAINLYKKYGFSSLGTRKGYYQDNDENALIMWTENIFYDKFKSVFEKNREKLFKGDLDWCNTVYFAGFVGTWNRF